MKLLMLSIFSTLLITACASGKMKVQEHHYFAVSNGSNTNYYRLNIFSKSRRAVARYSSGWFPASSVDQLFGDVSAENRVQALETRITLEKRINKSIIAANDMWFQSVLKPGSSDEDLRKLMNIRKRILAYPSLESLKRPFPNAITSEYDPSRGVAIEHADDKMVFFLSANPDEIIGNIAAFTENDKTILTINRLNRAIADNRISEVIVKEEEVTFIDKQHESIKDQLILLRDLSVDSIARKDVLIDMLGNTIEFLNLMTND